MKRLLLFLLVFGTGLAVLLYVQSRVAPEPTVTPEPAPGLEDPGDEVPDLTPVIDEKGREVLVGSSGRIDHQQKDEELRLLYRFVARDHESRDDGSFDVRDVRVTFYTPETARARTVLQAKRGRIRLDLSRPGDFTLDESYPITLEEVPLQLLDGPPFAPITMTVPTLVGRFGERKFASDDPVELIGTGLRATGSGLDVTSSPEAIRLRETPRVELELEGGGSAMLTSTGALTVTRRVDLGEEIVEIEALGSPRLVFSSDRVIEVDADEYLRLFGRVDADGAFSPERAEAAGNVVVLPEDGRFEGATAEISFEADGPVAVLDGEPRVELALQDVSGSDLPGGVELPEGNLPVVADGAGPLTVSIGSSATTFDFGGPVRVAMPSMQAELQVQGRLFGSHEAGESFDVVEATGGVVANYGGSMLETRDLEIGAFPDWNGQRAARLFARGRTTSSGTLSDGRPFNMVAGDGLVVLRSSDTYRVPEAREVRLEVGGEDGFDASARTVRDFDERSLSFVAEGAVSFENSGGRATGELLESFGLGRAELSGTEVAPARYVFPEGQIDAGWIEYLDDRVDARDGIRGRLEIDGDVYELTSSWASIDRGAPPEGESAATHWTLDAGGDVRVLVVGTVQRYVVSSQNFRVRVEEVVVDGEEKIEPVQVLATGDVELLYDADFQAEGRGETLEILRDRTARLRPLPGERVTLSGELPTDDLEFDMSAEEVELSPDRLVATSPDLDVLGVDVPIAGDEDDPAMRRLRAIAGRMACDEHSVLFTEGVYLGRLGPEEDTWSLDAQQALITGRYERAPGEGASPTQEMLAWGGFVARFGDLQARGDHMHVDQKTQRLAMVGGPAELVSPNITWSSRWFEMNLMTGFLRAGPGELRGTMAQGQNAQEPWRLRYASLEPIEGPDETIQVLREPQILRGDHELRASWALFWIDSQEWARVSGETLGEGSPPEEDLGGATVRRRPVAEHSLFAMIDSEYVGSWLREVYLEGNITFSIAGTRKARAEAVYLDGIDGHGWLKDVEFTQEERLGRRDARFQLSAEWLRHSADGSLRADGAVITSCSHAEPHYVVEVGDLRMEPRYEENVVEGPDGTTQVVKEHAGWNISARDSKVAFGDNVRVPLPRIRVPTDKVGDLDASRLSIGGLRPISFGNDSRFGNFISTSFTRRLGSVARRVHLSLGGRNDLIDLEGETRFDTSWLGSRGVLFGVASDLGAPGRYWLSSKFDGLYDRGQDGGLIQVDEDDRGEWRSWYRARGRYYLDRDELKSEEWLDFVLTTQTDPGVQAEFFEGEYLAYEERETYLHWRRARNGKFAHAKLDGRLEDFRTEIVEQPEVGFFHGRENVGELWGRDLLYTSDTTAGYFARREGSPFLPGDPMLPSDEQPAFADGFGERDVLRVDTRHRLEQPIELGTLGLRATPFIEGRGTAWDEDLTGEEAARGALIGGVNLATTFWRRFGSGSLHVWTPQITWRGDFVYGDEGNMPVPIDGVEQEVDGRFVDVGLRSRWTQPDNGDYLDVEFFLTHADSTGSPATDGWQPLQARALWLSSLGGMPFAISHDARYDFDDQLTPYARTFLGWQPRDDFELEAGYNSARDLGNQILYNALTLGGRYTFSTKWELEGRETFSTRGGGGRLASEIIARRFGHDFVFEVQASFVAGEGGSSIRFKIIPLLAWKDRGIGLVERWRQSARR